MKQWLRCFLFGLLTLAMHAAFFEHSDSSAQQLPGIKYTPYSFGGLVGTVQTVKGTKAIFGGYEVLNSAGTVCYLQIFDVATATTVTLGTTVPTVSLGFPAGAAANIGPYDPGITFSNGIKIAATTTRAGATPCGTGMDVNLFYK